MAFPIAPLHAPGSANMYDYQFPKAVSHTPENPAPVYIMGLSNISHRVRFELGSMQCYSSFFTCAHPSQVDTVCNRIAAMAMNIHGFVSEENLYQTMRASQAEVRRHHALSSPLCALRSMRCVSALPALRKHALRVCVPCAQKHALRVCAPGAQEACVACLRSLR